jgi:peptide/histidine transporter 3/4
LDKAAVVKEGDLGADGKLLRPWRLCTVHQVEQLKIIIRIMPIMLACMLHTLAVSQQTGFSVLQANTMDRRMFAGFKIPAASTGVIPMLTIMIVLPLYDKVVLPYARRVTGSERGITFLQRLGLGYAMGIAAMVLSGIVEAQRRRIAAKSGLIDEPRAVVPMSVFWLMPQLCLMGVAEAFTGVGQAEFFYDQVPEGMRSTAGSINSAISGIGVYISVVILTGVQKLKADRGRFSWLDDNLNRARLDRYYYIVAGLIGVNLLYFLVVSHWYSYKNAVVNPAASTDMSDGGADDDKEMVTTTTTTTTTTTKERVVGTEDRGREMEEGMAGYPGAKCVE